MSNIYSWTEQRSFMGFFCSQSQTSKLKIRSLFGNLVCRLCAWHRSKICNYTPVLGSFIFSRRHAYVDNATEMWLFFGCNTKNEEQIHSSFTNTLHIPQNENLKFFGLSDITCLLLFLEIVMAPNVLDINRILAVLLFDKPIYKKLPQLVVWCYVHRVYIL